ncbi:TlpA family protein disulfide reductase [Pontibacter oryzae]|uniref:TlpA family protein disulfide reductase n=1 Tax=Pontibacter oryzae TaxID=2304593 RepID=A0A399SJ19_9BACT|nr:TlpA disulfide reductase family protein [Pontibacter oryzae]RIJ42483.1 TlpA family protein disulfide reductase [Pontibacter oryzae]
MKTIITLLISAVLVTGCKAVAVDSTEEKIDLDYVASKFEENSTQIKKVEYHIQRIDTFAQDGTVWNNKGTALIEINEQDDLFGFSFYVRRENFPKEYLYDNGYGFVYSLEDKTYKMESNPRGFLGSPGGQLVAPQIFKLDSAYTSAELLQSDDKYILKYTFKDDTIYNVTDRITLVELNKSNYLPTKITRSYKILGNKAVHQIALSDIKINDAVEGSVADYKHGFVDFELIPEEVRQQNKLIGNKLPEIRLVNLMNENQTETLRVDKLTLIDFWEVWCGPCIKSFPEVEKIKNKYPEKLQVIGIVSESKEKAIELTKKKGITFNNLIGNKDLLKAYSVNSYPRYFLVDSKGVVRKEYYGFSEQIEEDIKKMLVE